MARTIRMKHAERRDISIAGVIAAMAWAKGTTIAAVIKAEIEAADKHK